MREELPCSVLDEFGCVFGRKYLLGLRIDDCSSIVPKWFKRVLETWMKPEIASIISVTTLDKWL